MLTVVKLGGGKGIKAEYLLDEIASRHSLNCILVHGASQELNELQHSLNVPVQTITSPSGFTSRRTTSKVIELFEMVYCGKANKAIVEELQKRGVNAIGLSGLDGRMLIARRNIAIRSVEEGKRRIIRDDLSGKVISANTEILKLLLEKRFLPVITPPAITKEGIAINVDGDLAAAVIASEMSADCLVFLSNVPGILEKVGNENSLIKKIKVKDLDKSLKNIALGRMKKKLLAAKIALENGVERVVISTANIEQPILRAFEGKGTCIIE